MNSPERLAFDLTIRAMREADREAVISLILQSNLHEARLDLSEQPFALDRDTSDEAAAATLLYNRERAAACDGALMVAEHDDKVIAFMCWLVEEAGPFVRAEMRRFGYVADLVIDEPHRRKGIGQRLLAEAESLTRARGLKRLVIGVLAGNDSALGAYRRFGFEPFCFELQKALD